MTVATVEGVVVTVQQRQTRPLDVGDWSDYNVSTPTKWVTTTIRCPYCRQRLQARSDDSKQVFGRIVKVLSAPNAIGEQRCLVQKLPADLVFVACYRCLKSNDGLDGGIFTTPRSSLERQENVSAGF